MTFIKLTGKEDLLNVQRLWADPDVMRFVGFPDGLHETLGSLEYDWLPWVQNPPVRQHYSIYADGIGYCGESFYDVDADGLAGMDIKLLKIDHITVVGTRFVKIFVCSDGNNSAVINKYDLIHLLNGAYSVCNKDSCLSFPGFAEISEDRLFGLDVNGRNRVIQNENGRIFHQCAGDGNSLLLSTGKTNTSFSYNRIIAFRHILNEEVCICHLCRLLYFFKSTIISFHKD